MSEVGPASGHEGEPLGGRAAEADSVARFIREARGQIVVLSGKSSCGKSEFVANLLIPRLEGEVYYADCAGGLPARLGERNLPLAEVLGRDAVLILDSFDRMLKSQEKPRKEALEPVLAGGRATVVLVTADENLHEIFALSRQAPRILDHLYELQETKLPAALGAFRPSAGAAPLAWDPQVIAHIEEDLRRLGFGGAGPALVSLIDRAFRPDAEAAAGRSILPADYERKQGIRGILEDHLRDTWLKLRRALGDKAQIAGQAVLEEVVLSQGRSAPLELSGLAERLDVVDDLPAKCLASLAEPGGVLRRLADGRYEPVPPQLAQLVLETIEQSQASCRQAVRLLAEGMRIRRSLDTLLPADRFQDIHEKRTLLKVSADEAAFLASCALHHAADEPEGAVDYWLRRIPVPELRLATLLEALYDFAPPARRRAAALLSGFDQPEALGALHRLALEDEDEGVRRCAVASLAARRNERIREQLEQEAGKESARFRLRAIEALRIYPDDRCATFLRGLVNHPASPPVVRETAIQTLFCAGSTAGVDALVEIGLNDPDPEDRQRAGEALGRLSRDDLAARALTLARDLPVSIAISGGKAGGAVRRWGGTGAGIAVAVSGFLIHGLALLVLGARWRGIACLAVEAISIALMIGGDTLAVAAGILLWAGNCCVSLVLAAWVAHWRRTDSMAPQSRLLTSLAASLVIANILTLGLALHGIGHALTRRTRRGFVLLGLELLGIGFLAVTLGYPALFEIGPESRFQFLSAALLNAYFYSGFLLFAGTFAWDFIVILRKELFEARQGPQWRRRRPVLRRILSGSRGAAGILSGIGSAGRTDLRWANLLLRQFGADVPPMQLTEFVVQSRSGAPAGVVRCLARVKREGVVEALCDAWEPATDRQRAQFFQVLRQYPTEASLRCLREKRPRFGWWGSLLCRRAELTYMLRVWPKALIVTGIAVMPISSLLIWEAGATVFNPARTQLKELHRATKRPFGTDAMRFTAEFLARQYPAQSAQELAKAYLRQDARHWMYLGDSLGMIVLGDSTEARPIAFRALLSSAIESSDEKHRESAWDVLYKTGPDVTDKGLISDLAKRLEEPAGGDTVRLQVARLLRLSGPPESEARMEARAVLSKNISWLRGILNKPLSEEDSRMALDAIAGADDRVAVPALKELVLSSAITIAPAETAAPQAAALQSGQGATRSPAPVSDPKSAREAAGIAEGQRTAFRRHAVQALRGIGSLLAQDALLAIAEDARAGKEIQAEAQRQANLMDPLSDVRSFFVQGEYRRAFAAAGAKLSPEIRVPVRNELLYYLSESSLNLANTDPAASEPLLESTARYLEHAMATGDDSEVRLMLGKTLAARARQLQNAQRLDEARASAERAVSLHPGSEDAQGTLGGILYDLNRKDAALVRFQTASRLNPYFTWSFYMQGFILFERGGAENLRAAEEAALQAQGTDPTYPWSYRLLRDIYLVQGKDQAAVRRFEQFRSAHPQVAEIYSQLAYLYHERVTETDPGAYQKAYETNLALLGTPGTHTEASAGDALNNLVECSLTTGRYAETEKRARERLVAVSLPAQRLNMLLFLYASQVLRGDWQGAMASLNAAEDEQQKMEGPQSLWVYNGTLRYLAGIVPQTPVVQALTELVRAVNYDDRDPASPRQKAPPAVFERNRQALKAAAGIAAASK